MRKGMISSKLWKLLPPLFPAQLLKRRHRQKRRKGGFVVERLEDRVTPAVTVGTNFVGMDFADSDIVGSSGSVPPDTHAAAGPSQVIEVVNSTLQIFTKGTGASVFQQDLDTFFGMGAASSFDPVVIYDELAGRFVIVALDFESGPGTSDLLYAISDTSTPTGASDFDEKHRIELGSDFGDYPRQACTHHTPESGIEFDSLFFQNACRYPDPRFLEALDSLAVYARIRIFSGQNNMRNTGVDNSLAARPRAPIMVARLQVYKQG